MNRVILFRGFHPDENGPQEITLNGQKIRGRWVHGDFARHCNIIFDENDEYIDLDVIPETMGQYIGLTDKNERMIFEWDIVIFNLGRNLPNTIPRPLKVFFDERNAQFTCYASPYATLQKDMMSECEVIGNIFSNPELIEGEVEDDD